MRRETGRLLRRERGTKNVTYEDLLPQHWSPDLKKNFWFVVKLRGNPKRGEKCPN